MSLKSKLGDQLSQSASSKPLVSVIIACKNNSEYIRESLESLKKQTYTNWELIIIDNFSTDGTFEIAKQYTNQVFQLGPERSTQFNYGFSQSKGELIYRIGAEFRLQSDVIQKCVQKIHEGFDAVAIHNRSVGDSIWAKVRYLERESYRYDDEVVAVRFFTRIAFDKVGGFDENLVANEDFDLHNRMMDLGYTWSYTEAIEDHLGEPKNIGDVWKKFFYYGRTMGNYMKKNASRKSLGEKNNHVKLLRSSYKKFYGKLVTNPRLFLAFIIYMSVKLIAGGTGYLIGSPKNLKKS